MYCLLLRVLVIVSVTLFFQDTIDVLLFPWKLLSFFFHFKRIDVAQNSHSTNLIQSIVILTNFSSYMVLIEYNIQIVCSLVFGFLRSLECLSKRFNQNILHLVQSNYIYYLYYLYLPNQTIR
jgi:hypothetical protein